MDRYVLADTGQQCVKSTLKMAIYMGRESNCVIVQDEEISHHRRLRKLRERNFCFYYGFFSKSLGEANRRVLSVKFRKIDIL